MEAAGAVLASIDRANTPYWHQVFGNRSDKCGVITTYDRRPVFQHPPILALISVLILAATPAKAFQEKSDDLVHPLEVTAGNPKTAASSDFGRPGPIDVIHAARTNGRLEVFCGSKGFVVGRGGTVFDLEGGATLRLRNRLSVTGSYRMIGYDFRATGSETIVPQMAGPFLAVNLEF